MNNSADPIYHDFEVIYRHRKTTGDGRHGYQKAFVAINHIGISFEYCRLYEMSEMARYHSYEYTREESKTACDYLEKIKGYTKKQK